MVVRFREKKEEGDVGRKGHRKRQRDRDKKINKWIDHDIDRGYR